MNKKLIIEIKDNNSFVNLFSIKDKMTSIIFSKIYKFEFKNEFYLKNNEKINYDIKWIKDLKNDLKEIIFLTEIDEIFLSLNNSFSKIETKKSSFYSTIDNKKIKKEILEKLIQNSNNKKIIDFSIDEIKETPLKKVVFFSYECVNKNILEILLMSFKTNGMQISKIISSKKAIENSLRFYLEYPGYKKFFNIQIEDSFTTINFINNKKFKRTIKKDQGLIYIYKKISEHFKIDLKTSEHLFSTYGSIPPESVVDNRIIFNGINKDDDLISFSKKDLSKIITFCIQDIYADLIKEINSMTQIENNFKIIFSGKIINLNGFENFSKEFLGAYEIKTFKNNQIGFESKNEIITSGMVEFAKNKKEIFKSNNNKKEKSFIINSKQKFFFQIFINKINKYYNYL